MSKEQEIKITNKLNIQFSDLMRPVDFSVPFTLKDVLRAAVSSTHIPVEVMASILRCYNLADFWKDACKKPYKPAKAFEDDGGIEYLELAWFGSRDTYKGQISQSSSWIFGGVGKKGIIPKDLIENKIQIDDPENYRTHFAVELTPISELKNLPIKICCEMQFTDEDKRDALVDSARRKKGPFKWPKRETDPSLIIVPLMPTITLIELLYNVLWELSFFGSPEERDATKEDLSKRVEDFKTAKENGTLKTVTINNIDEMMDYVKKQVATKSQTKLKSNKAKGKHE
jgi:hypothetical protein